MERKKSFRILLLFTMLIVLFATLFMNNMKILTIVSLLQLVLSIYFCCKYLSFKFISSINIFLAFSYLFHASKYFIFKPEMEGKAPFALIYTASISEMNKALYFYILIQAFFMIGVAISKLVLKTPKSKVLSKLLATNSKKNYLFIGIVLILIGILPKVYIEISKLKVYLQGGYLATYEVSISGILSFVSRLFEFGMMMLLIYFRDNKKVALPILMLGILAELPAIFSGGRGIAIIILIVYALIFITKILKFDMKKIKWPYIIIALLIIHLTLSIINFIGDYRTTNIETSKLLSSFVPYLFKFSLFDIVDEFGGTMIALILAMRFVPSIIGYGYGVGYASGFLNIFPNVNGFIDSYRDSMVYVSNFPVQYQQYMGGSYIGELYFNFGYFSVIFAILIGIFIGFICNMVSNKNNYDKSLSYIICLIIYTNMLWWIRDYFSGMIREIIWSAIIIIILNVIANTIFFKINKE